MKPARSIWVGFDPREAAAFAVARHSLKRHLSIPIPITGVVLSDLQARGIYTRPIEWRDGSRNRIMWDTISDAPMSTEHANARFLVPHLAGEGWALFMDGDMLVRGNVARLFDRLDNTKAIYCVKHRHQPELGAKMTGQVQTRYMRKNWSSFCMFNCDHPANKALTLEIVNTLPGRDLHRFCWIDDDALIGELGPEWNWLVGQSEAEGDPCCVHFTEGLPDMPGYENVAFAEEWRKERAQWAFGAVAVRHDCVGDRQSAMATS